MKIVENYDPILECLDKSLLNTKDLFYRFDVEESEIRALVKDAIVEGLIAPLDMHIGCVVTPWLTREAFIHAANTLQDDEFLTLTSKGYLRLYQLLTIRK
jgi:hypothetical protein